MAISFGGISAVSTSQTPTSVSVSGSNTVGLVYVVGDSAADNVSAVTWNGSSMTKINFVQTPSDRYSSVWYIIAPTAGATTISFTGGSFWRSFSMFYNGVVQTSPIDSNNKGTSSASTVISVATTVVASNCWGVMFQKDDSGSITYTPSNILTSMRANADAGGIAIADSNGTISTGSQTGTLTGTSANHGGIIISLAPAISTFVPKITIL